MSNNLTVQIHLVGKPVCSTHGELANWITLRAAQIGFECISARVCLRCLRAAVGEQIRYCDQRDQLVSAGATREDAIRAALAGLDRCDVELDDTEQRMRLLELG